MTSSEQIAYAIAMSGQEQILYQNKNRENDVENEKLAIDVKKEEITKDGKKETIKDVNNYKNIEFK